MEGWCAPSAAEVCSWADVVSNPTCRRVLSLDDVVAVSRLIADVVGRNLWPEEAARLKVAYQGGPHHARGTDIGGDDRSVTWEI